MRKNILALLLASFALLPWSFGQSPVVIHFSDATATQSTVTVNVTADDFTDISGMQLFIGWDATVLTFSQITNINAQLDGFNSSSFATPPQIPQGHVNVSWFSTNPQGESENLPDGTTLFSIILNVIGDPCDETDFALVDFNGQPNEAYDGDFTEVDVIFTPGTVEIPGEDCGGTGGEDCLGLTVEEIVGAAGTNVCVAIKVDSFVNINSAQFAVKYDQTVLEYTGFMDGPLTDELINPTGTNNIRFLWLVPADENPNTLADGTTLIEFCFNVIGDLGDISVIDIISITTPPALEIEFIDGDGNVVPYCIDPGKVTVGTPVENPVTFIASSETGDQGQSVCIDITCENFEDVGSFQWAFTWNPSVMTYKGLGAVKNINITANDVNLVANNKLRVSWLPTTATTKPDGTILFQLCFDLVGDCGDETDASFISDGSTFQIEVGDGDGNALPYATENGHVDIECACSLSYSKNDVSCHGEKDGSIYITFTGCTAVSYLWNTGQTTKNLEGIGAGSYRITITDDGGGQTVSDLITITEPTQILLTETVTNVSCSGKGSIQLTVSGGTPGYSYAWTPNVSTGPTASNLEAGTYSVTVTDNNDCEITKTFGITTTVTALVLSGSMEDITCRNANDGSISISATGGCPNYSITWSDAQAAGQFNRTGLGAGSYTATVTDQSGQSKQLGFTITNPVFFLMIDGVVTDAIVGGNGTIDITISGGTPDYIVQWSNGATTQDLTAGAGTYTVYVTDERGCSKEASFTIEEYLAEVSLTATAANLYNGYGVSCFGECDGKINVSVTANDGWVIYLDDVATSISQIQQMSFCPGEYEIRVVDQIVEEATVTVEITEPEQLEIELEEITCSTGEDGTITVTVSGGVEDYVFNWGVAGQDSETAEGLEPGTYGLLLTDANKCQALLSDLEVERCETGDCFLGTPVITPNNDGINDLFVISCLRDYPDNRLDIYDRWGQKVFSQADYDGSFDGTGTDGLLDEGSYMWVLTAFLPNGDERQYRGTLTLFR